jgi:hypothetical protein
MLDCISQWLVQHEECPICRHNYFRLDGEDDALSGGVDPHQNNNMTSQDNHAIARGMELILLLRSLQAIAESRPNTTIRVEGVELANGQRGNVEIQRPLNDQNVGLNIRVSNENGESSAEMSLPNEGTIPPSTNSVNRNNNNSWV